MSDMEHFEHVSYVHTNIAVDLRFDGLSAGLNKAQMWLAEQVLQDCRAVMPLLTGLLQQRSHTETNGRKVVFPGPYGRCQYMGKVMVDPETNSPWARKGAVKVVTDRDLRFAAGVPHWAEVAQNEHGNGWAEGCKRIILGESNG